LLKGLLTFHFKRDKIANIEKWEKIEKQVMRNIYLTKNAELGSLGVLVNA